jgi:5-methylcytosine-specific restriction endonuclease McrA
MELDHVTPRAAGGKDYCLQNIRAVCRTCNTARSRMTDAHFQLELKSIVTALTANDGIAL